MIEASGVSHAYNKHLALDDLSFFIPKGQIAGLLGPNGAGKSTLMKIITGNLVPSKGEVKVCGLTHQKNTLLISSKIGYLPENNPLYPEMYILEYLHFVADFYTIKDKKKRVYELLEITGLTSETNKKIGELSKGFRQRVGLAQALMQNPEVLILDEPTSGLDPNQITEMRRLILSLAKEKTILISTHIMQEVTSLCSRVIIINKGKIVADEPLDNLVKQSDNLFVIEAEFLNDISSEEMLQSITGIRKLSIQSKNCFVIEAETDIREQLFDFSIQKQNRLISLTLKQQSLEEVFQNLTR